MTKQVAILMKKQLLQDEIYLFQPAKAIIGHNYGNCFQTKDQTYFKADTITLMKTKEELCYYYPIDDKDLLEKFSCNNIELCMEEYFDDASQKVYLGTTNHTENHIEISPMSTQELSELLHAKKIESTNLEEKDNQDTDKKTEQDINIIISNYENNNIRIDIDVEELEAYVRERIFGQDEHLKGIITLLAMNYRTSNPQEIKKGLLIGPTGCGKTEILNIIADYLAIPFTNYSAPDLSSAGYVGKDIDDILRRTYFNAFKDVEQAENGILFIDEIDKLARNHDQEINPQPSLLKLIEGHEYSVKVAPEVEITIDTSLMSILCGGAFEDLEKEKRKNLGFIQNNLSTKNRDKYTNQELINYGLMPEFIGRMSNVFFLNQLTDEDLANILLHSKISPLLLEQARIQKEFHVNLRWDQSYIQEIIAQSRELNSGARSLKRLVASSLIDLEFELLKKKNQNRFSEAVVSQETLEDNKVYTLKK